MRDNLPSIWNDFLSFNLLNIGQILILSSALQELLLSLRLTSKIIVILFYYHTEQLMEFDFYQVQL